MKPEPHDEDGKPNLGMATSDELLTELRLRLLVSDAAAEAYRCAFNGGTCERHACIASKRCHAKTNAALVGGHDARVAELAAIQRVAMAGESGEVPATRACGEIALRLGHLYAA